jgi:hypothetical protein
MDQFTQQLKDWQIFLLHSLAGHRELERLAHPCRGGSGVTKFQPGLRKACVRRSLKLDFMKTN